MSVNYMVAIVPTPPCPPLSPYCSSPPPPPIPHIPPRKPAVICLSFPLFFLVLVHSAQCRTIDSKVKVESNETEGQRAGSTRGPARMARGEWSAGVNLYVMDWPYRLPFPYRTGCPDRSAQLRVNGISSLLLYSKWLNVHNHPSWATPRKEGTTWYSSRPIPFLWQRVRQVDISARYGWGGAGGGGNRSWQVVKSCKARMVGLYTSLYFTTHTPSSTGKNHHFRHPRGGPLPSGKQWDQQEWWSTSSIHKNIVCLLD